MPSVQWGRPERGGAIGWPGGGDRKFGMKWRVILELVGADGTDWRSRSERWRCSGRIRPTDDRADAGGRKAVACGRATPSCSHADGGLLPPPETLPAVIVYFSLRIGTSILTAASRSFIGLGAQPPSPESDAMLADGRSYPGVADHLTLFPTLAISITVLAFNLLGDGLRDALDQKLRT
jgi:hypothetical protein